MITILLISIFICWIAYSAMEGRREGFYWQMISETDQKPTNEHNIWSIQRTIVCVVFILFSISILDSFKACILLIISYPLSFPFIHDGLYYRQRNIVSKGKHYPLRFWDFSTTSTAFWTKFNRPVLRSIYFTASLISFTYSLI